MAKENWEKSVMMETESNQSTDAPDSAQFRLGTFAMADWEKDQSVPVLQFPSEDDSKKHNLIINNLSSNNYN